MHFGPTFVEAFGQLTSSRANTPRLDFIRTILEVRPRPQPVLGPAQVGCYSISPDIRNLQLDMLGKFYKIVV